MKRSLWVLTLMFLISLIIVGCLGGETTSDPINEEEGEATENESGGNNDGGAPGGETETDESLEMTEFKQSPMLDDRDLPPVEERLPNEPKLTNEMPEELLDYEIGDYGGTIRTVTAEVDQDLEVFIMSNEPLINSPGLLGEEFTPNILLDYEVSDDQTEFTFYMREGLKWSDGEPVTVEDVRFAVEDVLFNEELTTSIPGWLRSGGTSDGEPMEFEVIDDFAFKISFDEPYGGFLISLSIQDWRSYIELMKPAHYLKDYHIDYTPLEELEDKIEEAGFDEGEWYNLFATIDVNNWELASQKAIGFPTLYPWVYVEQSDTIGHFERNPYYFKVDAEGNQLPYVDNLRSTYVQDGEMVTLETIAGEVDFLRINTALNNMPLYRENEENGGYKALLTDMHITPSDIFLNLTYEDETWREVVRDVRFRKALNLALDQNEIIDAIYYGFAEPTAMMDTTYDVEQANQLLDEMGMEVGSDGYRVGPDGETFSIYMEVGAQAPDIVPLAELVVAYWEELHLDVSMSTIDQALWGNRIDANELQATIIWTHTPLWAYGDWGENFWGPLWNRWNLTAGNEGEEPPEEVQYFYSLINQMFTAPAEEAVNVLEEIRAEMNEHLWYFVHIENVQQPLIVNENLGNVSDQGMAVSTHNSAAQFFYRGGNDGDE